MGAAFVRIKNGANGDGATKTSKFAPIPVVQQSSHTYQETST